MKPGKRKRRQLEQLEREVERQEFLEVMPMELTSQDAPQGAIGEEIGQQAVESEH
ncbi:MAG: hypothetical protein WC886_06265 [Saccharofermentanaceae bacterium]|jgi:hypothetical protein